ncbi:hypothetical protein ACFL4W_01455 [Planctomycetota bacterium]
MKRGLIIIFLIIFVTGSGVYAHDTTITVGTTFNGLYAYSEENGNGWGLDIHFNLGFFFNISLESFQFPEAEEDKIISRTYWGVGPLNQLFEVQRGRGDGGDSWRYRANISLAWIGKDFGPKEPFVKRPAISIFEEMLYPTAKDGVKTFRGTPVLSLMVDHFEDFKRYGIGIGILW